jgi:hypothetical protein
MLPSRLKKSFLILTALLATVVFSTASAKSINLYADPKADAKSVGTMDSNASMVPIFTSKDGAWMKVGDPKNGNVGWVKTSDLTDRNSSGFSFSQQTVNTADGPKTTIQFGVPQAMTDDQIKEIQKRQAEIQNRIQKVMQDMYHDLNTGYPAGFPVFMPVIVVPPQNFISPAHPQKPINPPGPKPPVPPVKPVKLDKPTDTQN